MTSRQRVRTALEHREPDRVPFDLGSTRVTGITVGAYRGLREALGMPPGEITVADPKQGLAEVEEAVLERLEVDVRGILPAPPAGYRRTVEPEGDYLRYFDEWGIAWRTPKERGLYYDMSYNPLAGVASAAALEAFRWPDAADAHRYAGLRADAAKAASSGAAVVLGGVCAGILEEAAWLMGFADFYTGLAAQPDLVFAVVDRVLDFKMAYWQRALAEVGDLVDLVMEADDLGFQDGLMMSPRTYRDHLKPRHARLFAHIKSCAPVRVFFHTCGAVREVVPDLIEAGIDILNPVQVNAAGMDTAELKREFGDALTFWGGGVDTQGVLPHGSPQQVRDEVRRRIEHLAPGGGFVFNAVHNIQADVPPANLLAMWEALREYGMYQ